MDISGQVLIEVPDDYACVVEFSNGNAYELSNFEMVDESVYNRLDIYVADVVRCIRGSSKLFPDGSKIQFSIIDIDRLTTADTNQVLYDRVGEHGGGPRSEPH